MNQSDPPDSLAAGLSWLLGFAAGWIASVFASPQDRRRRRSFRWTRQWRRQFLELASESEVSAARSLDALRRTMVGRNRAYVVDALGPPPAVSPSHTVPSPKPVHYWHAQVWYYPLDVRRHQAVAVAFEDDVVRSVEHLAGPG